MKIKFILFSIIVCCFLLNSCAYENKQRKESFTKRLSDVKTKILKGITTKKDILNLLGDPIGNKKFNKWNYDIGYVEMTAWDFGGELLGISPERTGESYALDIYFDDTGVVQDYEIKKIQ